MKRNELFTHYNLSECLEQEEILSRLDGLTTEGKIEYYYEIINERFKLVDLDLTDNEVSNLINLFYDNDVLPDLDYEEPIENIGDMGYYEDYE